MIIEDAIEEALDDMEYGDYDANGDEYGDYYDEEWWAPTSPALPGASKGMRVHQI